MPALTFYAPDHSQIELHIYPEREYKLVTYCSFFLGLMWIPCSFGVFEGMLRWEFVAAGIFIVLNAARMIPAAMTQYHIVFTARGLVYRKKVFSQNEQIYDLSSIAGFEQVLPKKGLDGTIYIQMCLVSGNKVGIPSKGLSKRDRKIFVDKCNELLCLMNGTVYEPEPYEPEPAPLVKVEKREKNKDALTFYTPDHSHIELRLCPRKEVGEVYCFVGLFFLGIIIGGAVFQHIVLFLTGIALIVYCIANLMIDDFVMLTREGLTYRRKMFFTKERFFSLSSIVSFEQTKRKGFRSDYETVLVHLADEKTVEIRPEDTFPMLDQRCFVEECNEFLDRMKNLTDGSTESEEGAADTQ